MAMPSRLFLRRAICATTPAEATTALAADVEIDVTGSAIVIATATVSKPRAVTDPRLTADRAPKATADREVTDRAPKATAAPETTDRIEVLARKATAAPETTAPIRRTASNSGAGSKTTRDASVAVGVETAIARSPSAKTPLLTV